MRLSTSIFVGAMLFSAPSLAQYNASAGKSAPRVVTAMPVAQSDGTIRMDQVETKPAEDKFGNVAGNQYDLARDGAFDGETVAVLHLYTGEGFDFHLPTAALKEKGFSVYRWSNGVPPAAELESGLAKASQLWVISGASPLLGEEHLRIIKKFFDQGHGVYVWGDNEPYYADANAVASRLVGATMSGNLPGAQVVGMRALGATGPGLTRDHLVTTGLEQLYEGITIATVKPGAHMQPLVFGSAGNLVTSIYEHDGKRAIVDGGFTRLYVHWDTAGTARYVKNAAAWLANAERFGTAKPIEHKVVATDDPKPTSDEPQLAPHAQPQPQAQAQTQTAPQTQTIFGMWPWIAAATALGFLIVVWRARSRTIGVSGT
jgi:hypothetical protein